MTDRVPFTILTGWLGAGKTTVLNRMLAANHGKRIAVLVNELGRIAIDTQLIIGRGGDVLELAGGCVCCKVDIKNDLWDGIGDIVARARPDHVVLETTGIAEPAAILDGFIARRTLARAIADEGSTGVRPEIGWRPPTRSELLLDQIEPAGVICVVDAETGGSAIETREEARNQAESADRVLLAKLDVAAADAVQRSHAILDAVAPSSACERAAFPAGEAGARAMTDWVVATRPLRAWSQRPHHAHHDHAGHHHANQLIAVAFTDDAPLVGAQVLAAVERLGERLVRAKGFVHLAGDARRGFLERAGVRTELRFEGEWGTAPRRTELVLIGDGLDEAAIYRALWACRAGA